MAADFMQAARALWRLRLPRYDRSRTGATPLWPRSRKIEADLHSLALRRTFSAVALAEPHRRESGQMRPMNQLEARYLYGCHRRRGLAVFLMLERRRRVRSIPVG